MISRPFASTDDGDDGHQRRAEHPQRAGEQGEIDRVAQRAPGLVARRDAPAHQPAQRPALDDESQDGSDGERERVRSPRRRRARPCAGAASRRRSARQAADPTTTPPATFAAATSAVIPPKVRSTSGSPGTVPAAFSAWIRRPSRNNFTLEVSRSAPAQAARRRADVVAVTIGGAGPRAACGATARTATASAGRRRGQRGENGRQFLRRRRRVGAHVGGTPWRLSLNRRSLPTSTA